MPRQPTRANEARARALTAFFLGIAMLAILIRGGPLTTVIGLLAALATLASAVWYVAERGKRPGGSRGG